MRKILCLLAIAGIVGCGGSGNNRFDLSNRIPAAGTYTGDGSINVVGTNNEPYTASIQSAEIDSQGQTNIVVGPFVDLGGNTYTVTGAFQANGHFAGNISTNGGETNTSVTGTYISSNSEFTLTIPSFPSSTRNFTILGQLNNPQ